MSSQTPVENLYDAYLRGFSCRLGGEDEPTLPMRAAGALGERDSAEVGPGFPKLRMCSEVLTAVAQLVPVARTVPVDVDRLIAEGNAIATKLQSVQAQLQLCQVNELDAQARLVSSQAELDDARAEILKLEAALAPHMISGNTQDPSPCALVTLQDYKLAIRHLVQTRGIAGVEPNVDFMAALGRMLAEDAQ